MDPRNPHQKAIVGSQLIGLPPMSPNPKYLSWPSIPMPESEKKLLLTKIEQQLESSKDGIGFRKRVQEDLLKSLGNTEDRTFKKVIQLQIEIEQKLKEFIKLAENAIPSMAKTDIKRASANVWTMLSLQALNNQPLVISKSMLGYSMLYPLTDDIVDSADITKSEKKSFIRRFGRLISHGDTSVEHPRENQIWRMFRLIENDWDRKKYPLLYRLMGELLIAQSDSQKQLASKNAIPEFAEIWDITARKGALSVLCNAYLVSGKISSNEASFAAHFGIIAQILNDLKGIDEDLEQGQYTPMNMWYIKYGNLDSIVDYCYHYFKTTFEDKNHIKGNHNFVPNQRKFYFKVMLAYLGHKLLEGVAINDDKFSKDFLGKIERNSILPLKTLKKLYILEKVKDQNKESVMAN